MSAEEQAVLGGGQDSSDADDPASALGLKGLSARSALYALLTFSVFAAPLIEGAFQISMIVASLTIVWLRGRSLLEVHPLFRVFLGLFALWVVAGALTSFATNTAVRTSSFNYAAMGLAIIVGLELAHFADVADLKRLSLSFGAGVLLAALVGLVQLAVGEVSPDSWLFADGRGRGQLFIPGTKRLAATGLLFNRLKMSEMWLVALSALVAAKLAGLSWTRFSLGVAGAFLMLTLTFAKAAMGAAVIALVAIALAWRAPRIFRGGLFLGLAGLAALVPVGLWLGSRITPTLPVPKGSLEVRPWLWSLAEQLFAMRPWFGSGLGTYYAMAKPRVVSGYDVHSFGAHQQLLTVLVETGLVGVCLFWGALTVAGVALVRSVLRARMEPTRAPVTFFAACVFVAYLTLFPIHDVLFNPTSALAFWCVVGMSFAANTQERSKEAHEWRSK